MEECTLTITGDNLQSPSFITFQNDGGSEALRVAKDGFYVRGVKLKQNRVEAKKFYKAFKAYLRKQGFSFP